MVNPEIEKYVDTSLKTNMDVASIKRILVAAGWDPQDVDDSIAAVQNPGQRAAEPGAAMASPILATVAIKAEVGPKKSISKKILVIAGIVVLLLLVAGGVAFAFYKGILTFGGISDAELMAKLPDNLQAINSATYEGTLQLASEPREANTIPFNARDYYNSTSSPTNVWPTTLVMAPSTSFLQGIDDSYGMLPSDVAVSVTAGGSSANGGTSTTDAIFHAGADIKSADFNVSVDADFLKKNSTLYFRINKFPSFFIDFSALKSKWVAVTSEDLGNGGISFFDASSIQGFVNGSQNNNKKWLEQVRLLYSLAAADGVVLNNAPATSEKLGNENVRHFHLALAKDKMAGFYARATKELSDKYGKDTIWKFDQKTADYIASPEFGKLFDYLKANTFFDVWLNAETGQLAKVSYSLRMVPPANIEKLKDIQYVLRMALTLKDVNKPQVIEAPAGAMGFDDAQILLSGKSREEEITKSANDSVRLADISTLKNAISLYLADVSIPKICPNKNKVYTSDKGTDAVDGSGWLPVNLNDIRSGSPLNKLPRDHENKDSYVYSYKCDPTGRLFELNAKLAAHKNATYMSNDGGDNQNVYEVGLDLKLIH